MGLSKLYNVGSIIYDKLKDVCQTFPLVAENGVKFPFCIYRTTATRPQNTKDGIYDWLYNIEINVVSDKYDEACELSIRMADILSELEDTFDLRFDEVSENYLEDAYVRTINIVISK